VLVGCSHPGVVNIVKQAVSDTGIKPCTVLGGFHTIGAPRREAESTVSQLVKMGLKKIYPVHCSGGGVRSYLATRYGDKYGDGGVSLEVVVWD